MNVKLEVLGIVAVIGLVGFMAGCPFGSTVDLCADVTCENGFSCDAASGECVANADVCDPACEADETCVDGTCVAADACDPACAAGESCVEGACVADVPQGFQDADAGRGGALYDKWWVVAGVDAPTGDHALWADQDTNTREGVDTWRCKECHGWDYKGVDGVYGSGSHMTGFAGIFGTTLSAQEAFDKIATDHGFGDAGLADADIWDLAKFVLEGQVDNDDFITDGLFTGDAAAGKPLYDDGIDTNTACGICHGDDGLSIPPGADADYGDWVGKIANDNPWEFLHKMRFGQPGAAGMPAAVDVSASDTDLADLGAYSQTLATSAEPEGFQDASSARGGALYDKWWVVAEVAEPTGDHPRWALQSTNERAGTDTWRCKECHGWDYKGVDGVYGSGSHMTGFIGIFEATLSAQEAFDKIATDHGFTDAGLADADIWDLAKFVLEGQVDNDDFITDGLFTGDAAAGNVLYDDGIGTNTACGICHGDEGLSIPPGAHADYGDWVGKIANDNPWEFLHKMRFGQPGAAGMPAAVDVEASDTDLADLGAYSQTLPTE